MASFHLPGIRHEVRRYLLACMSLLAGTKGSHEEFLFASQLLQKKNGQYTDQELVLVHEVIYRVSAKLGT